MSAPDSDSDYRNDVTSSGRPRDEARRQWLRTRAAEVLVERQSCEISLKELADRLQVSSRMLVHHFGSRDELVTSALALAREQLLDACRRELDAQSPRDLGSLVRVLRTIVTDPERRRFFGLFSEVNALAQTQPDRFPGFRRAGVYDWLPQFTELLGASGLDDPAAEAQATLALAVIRGLMLDENATGDHARIAAALAAFERR